MNLRTIFLGLAALTLASLACPPPPAAAGGMFDSPAKVTRVALPADPTLPQNKAELTCSYYPHFMVKEVDLGEVGAEQLSILPIAAGEPRPACRRDNVAGEMVVRAEDWSGYFWGVKGGFVFFSADDGWNGGMGFAIFLAAEAKKIFVDNAKAWHAIRLTATGLALHYQRVYGANCSLVFDEAACWKQIQHDTAIGGTAPPDCTDGYVAEQARTPNLATQVLSDPTVFDYDVDATLIAGQTKIWPASGRILNCRPSE